VIIHSSNSAHTKSGERVPIAANPHALMLKSGVVDRSLGSPASSHITISRWPTPMFDGNRRIIVFEITGSLHLPFGRRLELPKFEFIYRQKPPKQIGPKQIGQSRSALPPVI
jgi:hypothetical protein